MSKNIYQEVTTKIIAVMKTGTAPWVRPWSKSSFGWGGKSRMYPHNLISNRSYNGINALLLMMIGNQYATGAWATYKQIKEAGGQVRKGEKSTSVVYFDRIEVKDRHDPEIIKRIPLLRYFSIFNHAQADWPDKDPLQTKAVKAEDASGDDVAPDCEATIKATGARIDVGGDVACYVPASDRIMMPARKAFKKRDEYYSTMFHELSHWTGAPQRLERKLKEHHAKSEYAFEELVAELGSAFVCAEHGIDSTLRHSASYLSHWIKCLQDDEQAIFKAAAYAQKAADYIMGRYEERQAEKAA